MKLLLAALLCFALLFSAVCAETPGKVESTDGSTVGTAGTSGDGTGTVGTNETPSSAESTTDTTGEDTPGPVTPPAVQAWYPIDSGMTETPTRVLASSIRLYYYNKLDGQWYAFCFDPLCTHQTEECLAYRLARSLVCGQNIEYSDYNGRLYVLRGQKIYSLRSDGSDVRLECSFGERGDWNDNSSFGDTESLKDMTLQGRYLYAENVFYQDKRIVATLVCYNLETGEVKSIVNMYRGSEPGVYYEKENGALSDMMEPGSTFKTLVLMAALDEGRVSLDDTVDVGNGRLKYHPRAPEVTDHNARKGGYGRISVANVIHGSSNIGMHKIVYDAYGNSRKSQAELVDKLHDMKVGVPMDLDIKGAAKPKIKHPVEDKSWSTVTSLSAISRGYEIVMPPIYTLAYYNAIANDGKLIRPFFVKSVSKDGQPVKTFSTETINPAICKPSTLKAMQQVLLDVVEGDMGTARPVKSDFMHIAGKTGTARMVDERTGQYLWGHHRVSFCGYFPADHPRYTGIVVVNDPDVPSAGLTSGVAFKNIAERTMALKAETTPREVAADTLLMRGVEVTPHSKNGRYEALQTVMRGVHQPLVGESAEWVEVAEEETRTRVAAADVTADTIPDVRGMGAKDAVYLLEKLGLDVRIQGRGRVVTQSVLHGTPATRGRKITLVLR